LSLNAAVTRKTIPITPAHPARREPPGTGQRIQLTAPPPLALYIHYPWCVRKCPYCDFNSHALRADATPDAELETRYIDALVTDIETALPQVWGRRVHTVFIGGGTPSLLSAPALDRLLTAVRTLLPLDPLAEITLEANPGTFEAERFREYRAAGVNRLSIGIQSFDDAALSRIGRIHDADQARRAVDTALSHFERVNLDIMYALPEQDMAAALRDMDIAIATGVGHISAYHLTLEPNTPFAHSPPSLPDSDLSADMQEAIEARLAEAGFTHYETSAFARPGQQCRHNLNYWQFGDYLGIGAGAHGKLSSHEGILREMRHKHPTRYLEAAAQRDFVQERRDVGAPDLPFEFMMNALRLTDGVPAALFGSRTGLPPSVIATQVDRAINAGLLAGDPLTLRPTEKGQRFLNDLLALFLPEAETP
jgi:oxygen-independent coproporphyrinogen-3 oxidase